MDESRRRASAALAFGLAGAVPSSLWAQGSDYPNKSITFLVPQAAGGSTDALAREIGLRLYCSPSRGRQALAQRVFDDTAMAPVLHLGA